MRIFLVGFMAAGKSTLARASAPLLGLTAIDLDEAIEQYTGLSIAEIFVRWGERCFREVESRVLRQILKIDNVIVATGGGTSCFHSNLSLMKQAGIVVYLRVPPDELLRRLLRERHNRPLIAPLSEGQLRRFISEKLNERAPYYLQAHLTLDVHLHTPHLFARVFKCFSTWQ